MRNINTRPCPCPHLCLFTYPVLSIRKARTMVLTAVEALIDTIIIQCITYINEILLLEDSKNGGSVFISVSEGKNTLAII